MRPLFALLITLDLYAISIIDTPIIFDQQRLALTQQYIEKHYGQDTPAVNITPRIIVIHWTASNDFNASMERFIRPTLSCDRTDINKASNLNVSAHFMVDRDGKIYRLMDETTMARHVIGLNHCAIGIENVGGEGNVNNLTPSQLQANLELIRYLENKYASIDYLIGHYEYTDFTQHPLWKEKDNTYRTIKHDPSPSFMQELRLYFPRLKTAPKL
jgi:N-acetyl-anhydromuramyl-L-alanine amidase AmpD